ncbi:hypothetical protein WDJ50_06500 [Deinococcus sp. VB142]|uniref:Uncharacterized protein n=1 Tax=Deinococcus sp. VB142 TaxID=3112952 RepID=A0AAU6Q5Y5_9DEIO
MMRIQVVLNKGDPLGFRVSLLQLLHELGVLFRRPLLTNFDKPSTCERLDGQ